MRSRDFAYWMQGFFEISDSDDVTPEQIRIIKKHLNLVFIHEIDPSMGNEEHQDKLNKEHNKTTTNSFPTTEEEAIFKWGPKPGPEYVFGIHGWYDPKLGIPRC